jgi:hypothetical protein
LDGLGIVLIFLDDWRSPRPAGSRVLGRDDMRGDGGGLTLELDNTNSRSDGHAVGSPPRQRQALLRSLIHASRMPARRYPTTHHGERRGRRVAWKYPGVPTTVRCPLTGLTDPEEYQYFTMLLTSSSSPSALSFSA